MTLAQVSEEEYTAVLMQGSGTFGVESVLISIPGETDKVLICANGAYGDRMEDMVKHAGISCAIYREAQQPDSASGESENILAEDPAITHVAMVHSETTSGIFNDIAVCGPGVKEAGKVFIVDAMSSFGGRGYPGGRLGD